MIVQTVLILLLVWVLYLRWLRRRMVDLSYKLTTIKHWKMPFIGHAYLFGGNDEVRMETILQIGRDAIANEDGNMAVWQGNRLYIASTNADFSEFVLKNCLEKDDAIKCLQFLTGNGSIFAAAKIWRPRRKVLAPTFSPKNLMQFAGIFSRQSAIMVDQLRTAAGRGTFSIWQYITTYTMDSVCESTLGVSVNSQKQPQHPFLMSFEKVMQLDSARLFKPWLHNDEIYKLAPVFQKHKKNRDTVCEFVDKIVQAKRLSIKNGQETTAECDQNMNQRGFKTFLELLINTSGGSQGYTDLELREETLVLVMAGTDTSAVGISFTSLLLARHPDVQEKVYQELREVLGDSNRPIVAEDLPHLKYLDAVVKESLRLYPPVPFIARKVDKDVTLPSGLTLVEGCGVVVHIWAVHRNPRYWGEDAEEFRPERFIDTPLKNPAAFMPFSNGPRACLGYQYAMMSMKTAMASLLRQYRILPPAPDQLKPIKVKYEVMMKDVDKFIVELENRN